MIPFLHALALHTPCGTWIEAIDPPAPSPLLAAPTCRARPMVLAAGSFEPGTYEADRYNRNWSSPT